MGKPVAWAAEGNQKDCLLQLIKAILKVQSRIPFP